MALALLVPHEQTGRLAIETVDLAESSECRQYQRVLSVAASQENRLVKHAALRHRPGYDFSDPWLATVGDEGAAPVQKIVAGMPCQHVGSGDVVAYLGPASAGILDECSVRLMGGAVVHRLRSALLPLPTRPARQGEWAVAVDMPADQAHRFNGRRGICGLTGVLEAGRSGFWVMFEPSEPAFPPEVVLIAEENLVTLPTPPPGAARTPWEKRHHVLCLTRKGEPDLPTLADESKLEQQLALRDGAEDEMDGAASDGSVDLSGSDSESETDELFVGTLVRVVVAGGARHGCIEGFRGDTGASGGMPGRAIVRLLDYKGLVEDFVSSELTVVPKSDLELAAVCGKCGSADPESDLLICDNFCERCLVCMHIGCLDQPLKAVPEGAWVCGSCCIAATVDAGVVSTSSGREARGSRGCGGKPNAPNTSSDSTSGCKKKENNSKPNAKAKAQGQAKVTPGSKAVEKSKVLKPGKKK